MNWSRSAGAVSTLGMPGTSWRPKLCVDPRTCSTIHRSTSLDWSRGDGVKNLERSIHQGLGRCSQGHSQGREMRSAARTMATIRACGLISRSGVIQPRQRYKGRAHTHDARVLELVTPHMSWWHLACWRQLRIDSNQRRLLPLRNTDSYVAESDESPASPRIQRRPPVYRRASTAGSVSRSPLQINRCPNHGSRAVWLRAIESIDKTYSSNSSRQSDPNTPTPVQGVFGPPAKS
jgi:hypothetical protein